MPYVFLVGAVMAEIIATVSLRLAARGRKPFYGAVVLAYITAFALLVLTLREGMPLSIAYGIWAATGVAGTAIAAHYLFREILTRRVLAGIGIIVAGVLLVELGAVH